MKDFKTPPSKKLAVKHQSSKLVFGIKPLLCKAVHPAGLYFEDRHLQNFLDKSRLIHNWYECMNCFVVHYRFKLCISSNA